MESKYKNALVGNTNEASPFSPQLIFGNKNMMFAPII